ncbi:general stress protein [Paenibacillus beijingensis]|uniref:General stress protein 17M-like domain-containing protein n=1 Tax=Paenibacillus beijingensis TaxID=1126833 RepID=A0A0D5NKA8_9BACL|nr:general stress protein [Paenibacillus beijingensis]AJY75666.1 hypothetical protein VN24_15250 [Paenibacillus beijingensis]
MGKKIAVFDREEQAIQALEELRNQGFARDELKVIAKDNEHSRRVESETDVHADELQDLAEARSSDRKDGILPAEPGATGSYVAAGVALNLAGTNMSSGDGHRSPEVFLRRTS